MNIEDLSPHVLAQSHGALRMLLAHDDAQRQPGCLVHGTELAIQLRCGVLICDRSIPVSKEQPATFPLWGRCFDCRFQLLRYHVSHRHPYVIDWPQAAHQLRLKVG